MVGVAELAVGQIRVCAVGAILNLPVAERGPTDFAFAAIACALCRHSTCAVAVLAGFVVGCRAVVPTLASAGALQAHAPEHGAEEVRRQLWDLPRRKAFAVTRQKDFAIGDFRVGRAVNVILQTCNLGSGGSKELRRQAATQPRRKPVVGVCIYGKRRRRRGFVPVRVRMLHRGSGRVLAGARRSLGSSVFATPAVSLCAAVVPWARLGVRRGLLRMATVATLNRSLLPFEQCGQDA